MLFVRSGKATYWYKLLKGGGFAISQIGLAYFQYDISNTSIVASRQLIEIMLTESNDTKMTSNVFDCLSVTNKRVVDATLKVAHFPVSNSRSYKQPRSHWHAVEKDRMVNNFYHY